MISSFESFIALRYLRSKRKEVFISIITVISVLGVAVSVIVLDMALAIMTGLEAEIRTKLIDANAHIIVQGGGGDLEASSEVLEAIRSVEGVESAFPYTLHQAMLTTERGARGLLIRGVANQELPREKLEKVLVSGSRIDDIFQPSPIEIIRPDGTEDTVYLPPLIVGEELVRRMGISRSSPVMVFAPRFSASPQGLIPKLRRFAAVGMYSSGLIEYEKGLAYTSLQEAQKFFGLGNQVTGIEVSVEDLFKVREVSQRILSVLDRFDASYYTTDWTQLNKPLWDAMRLEKRMYFVVLLLLILVASFSIVSTLVMVVMEKGKDIAILKSMGATDGSILRVFLLQGSLIGFLGTLVGSFLGFLGCIALREYGFPIEEQVFSLDKLPVHVVPGNFLLVAVSALIITSVACIFPAYRASRLRPAEALRFE